MARASKGSSRMQPELHHSFVHIPGHQDYPGHAVQHAVYWLHSGGHWTSREFGVGSEESVDDGVI
jgi:hypothetical protein